MMKQCNCCGKLKQESEFNKCAKNKDGLQYKCRDCQKKLYYDNHEHYLDYDRQRTNTAERVAYKQQYDKQYYEQNQEQRRQYQHKHYKAFRQQILDLTPEQREHKAKVRKLWYEEHKEDINKLKQQKRNSDLMFRFNECVSSSIYYALKHNKACEHWENLVDFTFDELKEHIEKQFTPEMSWSNRGSYWELDHIIPVNTFNLQDKAEFKICWSLANLRPLEKIANRRRPKDGSDIPQYIQEQIRKGVKVYVQG